MRLLLTIRCPLSAAFWLCAVAAAQAPAKPSPMVPAGGQLPATAPTSMPAPIAAQLNAVAAKHPQRATVTYAAGLLNVRANDSSLNSILREIARVTGMTISGGVPDQRVFGNYGPAEPSVVLATLLDGTGTNLFLKETADNSPAELTLTPQNGGATPPSPSSLQYSEGDDSSAPPANLNGMPPGASRPTLPIGRNPNGAVPPLPPSAFRNSGVLGDPNAVSPSASTMPVMNSAPVDSLPVPATADSPDGIVSAPSGPPPGSTTSGFNSAAQASAASTTTPTGDADTTGSTSTNGVKTAEQVFQQLQQLRRANQAQQQGQSGAPQTTTPK